MDDLMGLRDKHIFVTGAGGGIGKAAVIEFLTVGAKVTAHDLNIDRVKANFQDVVGSSSAKLNFVAADIREEKQVEAAFDAAIAAFGPVNVVIANAGIADESQQIRLVDMSLERWQLYYTNNVQGTFLTVRTFLRQVRDHGVKDNVAIVITGSETGVFGQAGHSEYASGKSGLQYGLVRTLKNEITHLVPTARVNAVAPGWVDTALNGDRLDDPEVFYSEAQATVALRKIAQPEDVARTMVWLASEKWSGHVSGQCISVDGGMEGRLIYKREECKNL